MPKKKKKCPECGKKFINLGAHMRAHKNEKSKKKRRIFSFKRVVILMGLLSIVFALAGIYFVFNLRGTSSDVSASLNVPENVTRGVPFEMEIDINNQTSETLNKNELVLRLSDGLVNLGFEGEESVINLPVSDVSGGGLIKKTVRVLPVSAAGNTETIEGSFSFSLGSASFEREMRKEIEVDGESISLSIETPNQILSGSSFETTVNYKNNTDFDFPQLRLNVEFPESFTYLSSNITPTGSTNEWDLGALNANGEGELKITGRVQNAEEVQNTHATMSAGFIENFYEIASTEREVQPSSSPINLEVRQRGVPRTGERLSYEVLYENQSGVALQDVEIWSEMIGEMFNYETLETQGEFNSLGNVVRWNQNTTPALSVLEPSESGSVNFSIELNDSYSIRRLSDKNFTIEVKSRIESPTVPYYVKSDKTSAVANLETKVRGKTEIDSSGYFRDAGSGILNSGSMPPVQGQSTQYTIHWTIRNHSTDIRNVKVSAPLPQGVEWTGEVQSNGDSSPSYDEESGQVVWEIDEVPATKGVITPPLEAIFQVSATPTSDMVGDFQTILGQTTLQAEDQFTGESVQVIDSDVTSELPHDPTVVNDQGRVIR